MDPITTKELERDMAENGDAVSFPYWATQKVLWNGRPHLVQSPPRQWVNQETGD